VCGHRLPVHGALQEARFRLGEATVAGIKERGLGVRYRSCLMTARSHCAAAAAGTRAPGENTRDAENVS
jgi:hypothetical protein